jgi:hypothetical protein
MSLTSLIPGLSQAQWIATGVAAAALVGAASFTTYKLTHGLDTAAYGRLELADKTAQLAAASAAAAKQKALDDSGIHAAAADAQAQGLIVTRTVALTKEIPSDVTLTQDQAAVAPGARPGCVSYGLVRVLDAAVLGVPAGSLALPAGKSDDDCSPVEPSALAASVAGNYGAAEQNAQQLNDLIATVAAQARIVATPAS